MALSSYQKLPCVPLRQVERNFCLGDVNVEITSLDIASHGSFVVAGTSSGLILLFDLSNPSSQQDGLLIGQIRARGMHTNLILTVKFSEDSRFVFAGVSKGSSEMLAIDLGRVLVQWEKHPLVTTNDCGDSVQQLQLKNLITFNYSDAKLRGFGAVSKTMFLKTPPANGMFESSVHYRLACGKGIKNVHIWHFSVGYPVVVDGDNKERHLHGKWEYVCDVASNGNTITHIEFRSGGHELLSKSAGMCVRMWNLESGEAVPAVSSTTNEQEPGNNESAIIVESTVAVPTLKATYTDVANSQDVKCLLPMGTVAYGGTYQFAVVNTAAPKEANRDVLELPERYSGDGVAASTSLSGNVSSLAGSSGSSGALFANRGRRITREIEQVMCTNDGQQALVMCADGGVVYYSASAPFLTEEKNDADSEEEQGAQGCGGCLLELPGLFRMKDQQQHLGSWTLRRVGHQGLVVLLRAHSAVGGADVTIECKLLSSLLPKGALRTVLERENPIAAACESQQQVDRFYVDSLFHPEQVEARRAWMQVVPAPKKTLDTGKGHVKRVKLPSRVSVTETGATGSESSAPQLSTARKRKVGSVPLMDNSPAGVTEMATPATIPLNDRHHNETSPYEDATSRLTCSVTEKEGFIESHINSSLTTEVAATPVVLPSRSSGRSRVPSSSFAKLRALRDDASDDEVMSEKPELLNNAPALSNLPLHIPPAPKVRRTVVKPLNTAGPIGEATGFSAMDPTNQAVSSILNDWLNRYGKTGEVLLGRLGLPTLGACGMQRLSAIVTEQDRLKELFVQEVTSALTANAFRGATDGGFEQIIGKYAGVAEEMVQRQQLDLEGACAADSIVSLVNSNSQLLGGGCCERKVVFRHDLLFGTAQNFLLQNLITLRKCV